MESPFATVWLRTTAAKRSKQVENATPVIWKTLLVAEQSFRRLAAPELLAEVAGGVTYVIEGRLGFARTPSGRSEGRRLNSFTPFLTGPRIGWFRKRTHGVFAHRPEN